MWQRCNSPGIQSEVCVQTNDADDCTHFAMLCDGKVTNTCTIVEPATIYGPIFAAIFVLAVLSFFYKSGDF